MGRLLENVYTGAQIIHLVMDNIDTHFRMNLEEVLRVERAE